MQRRAFLRAVPAMVAAASWTDLDSLVAQAKPDAAALSLPDLATLPVESADAATNRFFDSLEALRHEVDAQVKNPALTESIKANLYRIAGELRVYQTMDHLINDIQFLDRQGNNPPPTAVRPYGVGGYTAQTALSTFGIPAFRAIMEVMSDHKAEVPFVPANTNAYAWVLWAIEGKRCALVRLQDQLAREQNVKVRSQYQMVIERLKVFNNDD